MKKEIKKHQIDGAEVIVPAEIVGTIIYEVLLEGIPVHGIAIEEVGDVKIKIDYENAPFVKEIVEGNLITWKINH